MKLKSSLGSFQNYYGIIINKNQAYTIKMKLYNKGTPYNVSLYYINKGQYSI